jgi:hypothetical protein
MAISIKSAYAEALFERGSVYRKQNNLEKAKADITAACAMGYKIACDYKF